MSKLALYQKYRSKTFDEVVGQETTVRTIQNAIRQNKVGHAYLFSGPRGTGKTTMARLLAKAMNCENVEEAPCEHCENCKMANLGTHPDIVEINAANETHVDDIRELIERSRLAPMVGKHKIYIIDEVHQLSSAASSALLKTLEEPPEHVIFILATTDPQKLLPTIISRCQRFSFYKIPLEKIKQHLLYIAQLENITLDEQAAYKIAILASGGMRDALSILDQAASFTSDTIHEQDVDTMFGLTSYDEMIDLLLDIHHQNIASILERIQHYEEGGIDMIRMVDGLLDVLKDGLVYQKVKEDGLLSVLQPSQVERFYEAFTTNQLLDMVNLFLECKNKFKLVKEPSSIVELACLDAALKEPTTSKPVVKTVKEESVVQAEVVSKPTVVNTHMVEDKPVEEEVFVSRETVTLPSVGDVVAMMCLADKESKIQDTNVLQNPLTIVDGKDMRYHMMVQHCTIGISGKDLILFVCDDAASAEQMMMESENHGLFQYLCTYFDIEKRPYAIDNATFNQAKKDYVRLLKENQLPKPFVFMPYERKVVQEEAVEDKVKKIFGDDVEVI